MKQVFQSLSDGRIYVEEVPRPKPGKGLVLVRSAASVVSAGTERMIMDFAGKGWLGKARSRPDLVKRVLSKAANEGILQTLQSVRSRLEQPFPLGYSCAGRVEEVGEGVEDLRPGDRVACAGAGYAVHAERVVVPRSLTVRLPDQLSLEHGAFTTLGAIAMHGLRLADIRFGETVAVIGLGLLGQLTVQLLKAGGCRCVGFDIRGERAELAEGLGAEAAFSDEKAFLARCRSLPGQGADSVLITADTGSNQPIELAAEAARDRAAVISVGAVGTELPRKAYFEKELTFRISRSYGPGRYDRAYEEGGQDYPIGYVRWTENRNMEAFAAMASGPAMNLEGLITHRFPVAQAEGAYNLVGGKAQENFLGVLITYPWEGGQPSPSRQTPTRASSAAVSGQPRVGVLGAGSFAQSVLLPAIKKTGGAELVGVCSGRGANAKHVADRFGFSYATAEEDKILDDPGINTIVVLTRHDLHARQVAKALKRGKHVFSEKPLSIDLEGLKQVIGALQAGETEGAESRGSLLVGYNRRFSPFIGKIKDHYSQRREPLLAVYRVNAGFIAREHWIQDAQEGGGRIVGEICHFVDALTFVFGTRPRAVTASALPDCDRYRQDNVSVTLEFEDGSAGTILYAANGDPACPKERLEVFGEGKTAVLNDFRQLELFQDGRKRTERSRLRQDKGHGAQWAAFLSSIKKDAPGLLIPLEELISTSLATFAIQKALQSGQRQPISVAGFLEDLSESRSA